MARRLRHRFAAGPSREPNAAGNALTRAADVFSNQPAHKLGGFQHRPVTAAGKVMNRDVGWQSTGRWRFDDGIV